MSPLNLPMTRYAQSGELNIAYQTMGNGPIDLILVPGLTTHVEFLHEIPGYTDFLRRLAAFARVVMDRARSYFAKVPEADNPSQRTMMPKSLFAPSLREQITIV